MQPPGKVLSHISLYLVVASTAAAVIGLELVQTRVLSALYYNHVVYMTVTIALMGFGISGTVVSVFAKRIRDPEALAVYAILGLAISSFLSLRGASNVPALIPYEPLHLKLSLSYLVLVMPFLCGGTALGLLFMRHAENIFRLYGTDLVASAAVVLVFSLLLRPFGADGFIWLCSGLALLAFVVEARRTQLRMTTTIVGVGVCALGFTAFGMDLVNDQPEPYKTSARVYQDDWTTERHEAAEWTTITKIDVFSDPARDLVSGKFRSDAANMKLITQDGDAFTIMVGKEDVEKRFEAARSGQLVGSLSLAYLLQPEPRDALVIGVGGGIDIVVAGAYGAQRIDGIELNPATVDLMMGPYADYALWPNWENVELHRAEGRNFVRNTKRRYDTVVMSGIDTFSALNSGAYVLAENYLYTVEAMTDYIDALKDDGVMAIFRWLFSQPRESLRLANLYLTASEQMGIADPSASMVVVAEDLGWEWRWASTFIKKKPFTPEEVKMMIDQVARVPNLAMVYIPKVFAPDEQTAIERRAFRDDAYLKPTREAYLGDPMFSLMVVLAGLLLFTGCGSLLAVRMRSGFALRFKIGMLGVAAMVPVWLFTMSAVLPATESWPFPVRIGVALMSLLPLGLLMGIPFATGLRYLAESRKQFVPWAWGINGLTSVMASILAVILAMRIGFTAVLILGACTYALGYLAIRRHLVHSA